MTFKTIWRQTWVLFKSFLEHSKPSTVSFGSLALLGLGLGLGPVHFPGKKCHVWFGKASGQIPCIYPGLPLFFVCVFVCFFSFFFFTLERERRGGDRERERERERETCCPTYLGIQWLNLICPLTRDQTHNLVLPGRRSTQPSYPTRAVSLCSKKSSIGVSQQNLYIYLLLSSQKPVGALIGIGQSSQDHML